MNNLIEDKGQLQPASELLPLVYEQLRSLAHHRMAQEEKGHTLEATALVHEAYVRLVGTDAGHARFASMGQFYTAAAEAMRRILIDHARARDSKKRGGEFRIVRVSLSTVLDLAAAPEPEEILAFDDAISRLEEQAPEAARVVRLRFYAGLSIGETASAMGVSERTVNREWTYARAWLYRELQGSSGSMPASRE